MKNVSCLLPVMNDFKSNKHWFSFNDNTIENQSEFQCCCGNVVLVCFMFHSRTTMNDECLN